MLALNAPSFPSPSRAPDPGPVRERAELDAITLARCKRGDRQAFRAFVSTYQTPVYALVSRLLRGSGDVDDLAQETFVRAYRHFDRFDLGHESRASAWILTIATRVCLDALRAAPRRAHRESLAPASVPRERERPDEAHERRELGRAIERSAMQLPDDQRAALLLVGLHGATMREVATALDIPEATAKTKVFRARQKMRQLLAAWQIKDGRSDG